MVNGSTFRGEFALGGSIMHRLPGANALAIGIGFSLGGGQEQRLPGRRRRGILKHVAWERTGRFGPRHAATMPRGPFDAARFFSHRGV